MQEPKNEIKASLRVFTKNSIKISFQEKTNGKFNRLISPTNIEDVINLIKYEELDEVILAALRAPEWGESACPTSSASVWFSAWTWKIKPTFGLIPPHRSGVWHAMRRDSVR
jgi:hypothetical protein